LSFRTTKDKTLKEIMAELNDDDEEAKPFNSTKGYGT
jgi:hypothetical protein